MTGSLTPSRRPTSGLFVPDTPPSHSVRDSFICTLMIVRCDAKCMYFHSVVDTVDNWDEKKLEEVCNYFLDAIENNKYGWFWVCPG
ncbi:unnamed protein product [Coregonus sp. 'balchen']|nr:unnamed protein product [Coregonus sp. 'balchen']